MEPIPAPDGLLAEFFVPNPDAAWTKARAAVAGPAMFLPQSASTLAATMLGLPMVAAIEIDGQVPLVGALAERKGGGRPRVALGVHVRDGDKLVDLVTKGESGRLKSRVDAKTGMTLLEPKEGGERAVSLGVLGNYLLVSQSIEDLLEVGPYVARTLPAAKMQKNDATIELPRDALTGPIAKGLRSSWETLRPKARAADGADPDLAPPPVPNPLNGVMDSLLAIVSELDHARVSLDFDEKTARILVVGAPREGGKGAESVAAMTAGDPRRVLDLPADSEVAIFLHDDAKARAKDAKGYAKALAAAIGKDVPAADSAAIEAALTAVAEGRGDAFTAGFSLLSTGPAAYVRSDVASVETLGKGLDDFFGLVKLPSVKVWLGQSKIGVSTGKTVLENVPGDVFRVRLERLDEEADGDKKSGKDKPKKSDAKEAKKDDKPVEKKEPLEGPPKSIDVLYMLGKDGLVLAAGYEAKAALKGALDAPSHDNLAGRADVKAAIEAVGGSAAFVAFIDPMRLLARRAGKAEPGPGAPVVFALGKGGDGRAAGDPWMRLDVANAAIQELVKRRGAL